MRKERQHYTADEKAAVLRRHLLDEVPVSDLCEELSLKRKRPEWTAWMSGTGHFNLQMVTLDQVR